MHKEEKMKINAFINCYSMSKTLRFKLAPEYETEKNLLEKGFLDRDKLRADDYDLMKKVIDKYHKHLRRGLPRNAAIAFITTCAASALYRAMLEISDFKAKQIIVSFCNDGDKIKIQNDNVLIIDKDGEIKCQCTCYRLFSIFVVGNTTLTSVLIERAKKFGFTIVLFTSSFRVYEVIGFRRDANILLHRKQYEYDSLDIAKHLIRNKISNQLTILSNQDLESARNEDAEIKRIDDAMKSDKQYEDLVLERKKAEQAIEDYNSKRSGFVEELTKAKMLVNKCNVRVISAKENITTDASGVLMESVLEGMAEYYSAELSQKVKRGVHESLLKGNYIGGYILYGYDVVN